MYCYGENGAFSSISSLLWVTQTFNASKRADYLLLFQRPTNQNTAAIHALNFTEGSSIVAPSIYWPILLELTDQAVFFALCFSHARWDMCPNCIH